MARPKNKEELLSLSQTNYDKLMDFVHALPEEKQTGAFSTDTMNRNIRDVLTHLHHWHLMMLDWYKVGMSGTKPDMPEKGYTWKDIPALNRQIWEQYQGHDLVTAKALFLESHTNLRVLIEGHSNEELFEKKRYKWTGTTSLGAYLISATSSHYDWAFKLIKKGVK